MTFTGLMDDAVETDGDQVGRTFGGQVFTLLFRKNAYETAEATENGLETDEATVHVTFRI